MTRPSSMWKRWLAYLAMSVAAVLAIALLVGYVRFRAHRDREYSIAVAPLAISNDPETLARGEHLAQTLAGCATCHGQDLGGRALEDDAVLRVIAPNLTRGRGGVTSTYTDADWTRAILHGVGPGGRSLLVMPSDHLRVLSDEDVAAIIAYCKSVPPVDRTLAGTEVRPLGMFVVGLTGAPVWSAEDIDHAAPRAKAPPPRGPTRAYGEYLVGVCKGCHGKDLRGGIVPHPGSPPSADISPQAMSNWEYPLFVRALREGKKRDGSDLNEAMPWRATQAVSEDEMRALWLALRAE